MPTFVVKVGMYINVPVTFNTYLWALMNCYTFVQKGHRFTMPGLI